MDYVYIITYYILTYIMYYVNVCVYICFYISLVQESCLVTGTEELLCIRPPAGLLCAVRDRPSPNIWEGTAQKWETICSTRAAESCCDGRGLWQRKEWFGPRKRRKGAQRRNIRCPPPGNGSQTTWGSLVPLLLFPQRPHRNCFPVENSWFFLGRLTIFNSPGLGDRVRQHGLEWSLGALWKLENSKSDTSTTTFISVSCSLEARVCVRFRRPSGKGHAVPWASPWPWPSPDSSQGLAVPQPRWPCVPHRPKSGEKRLSSSFLSTLRCSHTDSGVW